METIGKMANIFILIKAHPLKKKKQTKTKPLRESMDL
jgi:hypothetical protein